MNRHYHSSREGQYALNVDPQKGEWKYISFKVVNLRPGEKLEAETGSEEVVFVPLVGRGTLSFGGKSYELHRKDLFRDRPDIAYLPPKTSYSLEAIDALEIALGGAPAEGKLSARIIPHDKIATAIRGGANAERGVSTLADSDELTERLTVYEIHTPSGNWSSFPPIGMIRGTTLPTTKKPIIIVFNRRMDLPSSEFIPGIRTLTWRFPYSTEMSS